MAKGRGALFLASRLIVGRYFIQSAFNHFGNFHDMTNYAGSKDVRRPKTAVLATELLLLAVGTSIVLGYRPKAGAAAITTFFVGVTPVMHNNGRIEDGGKRVNEPVNLFKNLALLGAVEAMVPRRAPWPLSLDGRADRLWTVAESRERLVGPVVAIR